MPCWDWAVTGDHHGNPTPSTEALAHEHEGSIEVVVLAKLTGPNDCRLRWGGTASQVMCNLILTIRIHRSRFLAQNPFNRCA